LNRNTLIALVGGLAVGLFVGYQIGSSGREEARPAVSFGPPPDAPSPFGGGSPPFAGGPPQVPNAVRGDTERQIAVSQQIVAADPRNVQAWIQLGNDYFDTHRPQQSIEAYAKALEIQPNNPDVLTDQGVMYRELKQFDKAVANFKKANQLKPDHVQSLFNLGVVYRSDLKDSAKALQAWERVVQLAPASLQAADARRGIAEIKAGQGAK
jgi:cytochrome c-type biogenesis protein CcmH/NrfG